MMSAPKTVLALVSGLPRGKWERRHIMVLQACLDDSGELEESINPTFVLAGFIADSENWVKFINEWTDALAAPPRITISRWLRRLIEGTNSAIFPITNLISN
jgi:hypothetical protein